MSRNTLEMRKLEYYHVIIPDTDIGLKYVFENLDSPPGKELTAMVAEYNGYVDFLAGTENFIKIFTENNFSLPRSKAALYWDEETVNRMFSLKEHIFLTEFSIKDDCLIKNDEF